MKKLLVTMAAPVLVLGLVVAVCVNVGCSKPGPVVRGEGTEARLNDGYVDDGSDSSPENTHHIN